MTDFAATHQSSQRTPPTPGRADLVAASFSPEPAVAVDLHFPGASPAGAAAATATFPDAGLSSSGDQPRPRDALDGRREASSPVSASRAGTEMHPMAAAVVGVAMAIPVTLYLLWLFMEPA